MEVKIKKLVENAVIPKYSKDWDAGMDLTAVSKSVDEYGNLEYGTGLALEIPQGFVGLLFPRSSVCNYTLSLCNHVGVIDSGYRGELKFKFKHTEGHFPTKHYNVGDRVGQLIILPYPRVNFILSEDLSNTVRGEGGFGSSNAV